MSDKCGSYGDDDDVQVNKNGIVYSFGNIRELSNAIEGTMADKMKLEKWSKYSHGISTVFQKRAHYTVLEKLKEKSVL